MSAQRRLADLGTPPEKPYSGNFNSPTEFDAALIAYEVDRAERGRMERAVNAAAQAHSEAVIGNWQAKCAAYAASHPDFDVQELADRPAAAFPVTPAILQALLASDDGPRILIISGRMCPS